MPRRAEPNRDVCLAFRPPIVYMYRKAHENTMWIPGRENLDTYTRNFLRDPQGRLRCALSAMRNAAALPVGSCGESFLRYACSGCSLYEDYEERKNKPSRTAKAPIKGDEPHGGSFGLSRRGIFFIVRNQLKILFLSALGRKQIGLIDRICGACYMQFIANADARLRFTHRGLLRLLFCVNAFIAYVAI